MLLTHSRAESFKRCRRRHYYEYEIGVRPVIDAKALRMGSAWHAGLETLATSGQTEAACATVYGCYNPSANADAELAFEAETVGTLLAGYQWHWRSSPPLVYQAVEQAFRLPLVNPDTGRPSTLWELAGKIDGIALLDGRLVVVEHKLLSEDMSLESDWWRRLQIDPQVSIYVYAARQLGYPVESVLYDVARKPTIRPTAVPILDDEGLRIVVDQAGNRVYTKQNKPRQTASEADGYTLQTRPMTGEEWSSKLVESVAADPHRYFARVEVPRLDQDITECMAELWEIQNTIREAQKTGRWYRTVSRDTCPWCPYFGACSSKQEITRESYPEGMAIGSLHPELEEVAT